ADEHTLWFGQGFASAQDRLWQMEYDRRRAAGRWAEVAGPGAVAADALARRLQLVRASQADVEAMSPPTRAMFEAYAAGVNAFLESGRPLPPEYELSGIEPEPWQPWHSVAAFKVRHVLMGVWQQKLARAQLLAMIGAEAYARLDGRPPVGSPTILPPGGKVERLFAESFDELRRAASHLGFLAETEGGSNSWAVHGSRTTTGKPVLCNDSHRALDVPNVYWQVHLTCPDFDAIGATFPGFPGLPHFGHNGHVGWSITHTGADYQDLYVERFSGPDGSASPVANASDPADPGGAGQHPIRYLTPQGWEAAERGVERVEVAGASAVDVEVWRTHHGPVVHGDPRRGLALALRYTATDGPCRGFEVLRPMLRARTVAELQETQRSWVDPVNNLVAADRAGSIGYLTRGTIPIRSSTAHRQFPAPGWTGEHEWVGYVPFESLPRVIDPPQGFIATANQAVIAQDEPYIAHEFSPPFRAERIVELLSGEGRLTPHEIAAIQGDTTSRAARAWVRRLARSGPYDGQAEAARAMLAAWDGNLLPESGVALLYGAFRRAVARALFVPIVGERAWSWLTAPDVPATHTLISRWMVNVVYALEAETTPDGRPWDEVLPGAL
ncbi:MAG TPA: penicillin acylase family protein, partial [Chloroflexota bacterium]|nr:penicillin acylase family protein [Chloroflexota bacterium]